MSSRLLYDTRDNSILRCQPEPKGSAGLPSFNGLCKSARVPEDEKEYLDTIVVSGDYLTHTMQDDFRIVEIDNEIQVKEKPKVIILPSTTELDTSVNNILTIDINIQNILIIDNITSVDMRINDINFSIDIADNTGSMEVELQEVDTYEVACTEDRFISQPAIVEVV
jgi:hypothetical protein